MLFELACGLPSSETMASLASPHDRVFDTGFLLDSVLQKVARIFIGRGYHKKFGVDVRTSDQPQCTAIVKDGVCLWIDALRELSTYPASMATIHIAPGQIVYKERNYTSIWDPTHSGEDLLSSLTTAQFEDSPATSFREKPHPPPYTLQILAEERADTGAIRLVYGLKEANFQRTLQPGIITEEILAGTCRVPCPRNASCTGKPVLPCWQRVAGWALQDITIDSLDLQQAGALTAGFMWNTVTSIDKLLAIEGCRHLAWYKHELFDSAMILIPSDQCMACMTRYITTFQDQASWEHRLYYRGKRQWHQREQELRCSFHII